MILSLLLATLAVPTSQPLARCLDAQRFMRARAMASETSPDSVDDWRTGRVHAGCRVTAAGLTRQSLTGEATAFYGALRAAGWTRTPDPRDAPNEASLRFRRGNVDCLFNVYGDGLLFTDAELRVSEARVPAAGERRYGVLAQCIPALPAKPQ